MTFVVSKGPVGTQPIASTSTSQKQALGTIVQADDPTYGSGEFIYLKGLDSTVVGSWVTLAMSICVTGEYGWYQIHGKGVGKVLALFADNANCYATATAGSADDSVVAGDLVKNAKGASAIDTPSTGLAEIELYRPFMDDGLTA